MRIDEKRGFQQSSAGFALVSSGAFVSTVRTFPCDEPVGQEATAASAVEHVGFFAENVAVVVDSAKYILNEFFVDGILGSGVIVKSEAPFLALLDDYSVVSVGKFLRLNAELERFHLYRGSMLVRAADHHDIFTIHATVAGGNISR